MRLAKGFFLPFIAAGMRSKFCRPASGGRRADVGQIPPCATAEDRVLEMIGAREDIEIVAAELFETLSYFHFDKSVSVSYTHLTLPTKA